jgi:hypothetical protein
MREENCPQNLIYITPGGQVFLFSRIFERGYKKSKG